MKKDFDAWNRQKKIINAERKIFYHEREIWWCALGVNVGSEQDGVGPVYRRPVLILKSHGRNICLAIPLTTSTRVHPLRVPLGGVDGKEAQALLSQMRAIDVRRLIRKIGYLDKEIFERLRKTARDVL